MIIMQYCGNCEGTNTVRKDKQIKYKNKTINSPYMACIDCGFEFFPYSFMFNKEKEKNDINKAND